MPNEVEIKFRIDDMALVRRQLRQVGFHQVTRSTHEMNVLFDLPGQTLRRRGEMLRLRKYGRKWVLTHKTKGKTGRYKSRVELEIGVDDGRCTEGILRALGFVPAFRYEKYRAEWSDGSGHVVLDRTPIGNFGEIEGAPRWIDRTAMALGLRPNQHIAQSYAPMFLDWKRRNRSRATEMTFQALAAKSPGA